MLHPSDFDEKKERENNLCAFLFSNFKQGRIHNRIVYYTLSYNTRFNIQGTIYYIIYKGVYYKV